MTNESIWEKVDSVEKRFGNRLDKSNVKFNTLNPVWDKEKEDALNVFEMIDELNYLNDCCNNLIDDNTEYVAEINQMHKENEELKQQVTHLTMYKNLFREFQKQLDGVKKKSDLDHKDFEDLIELTKGHVFDDEYGWIWLPINDR